jgi:fumarate hydratase, class II
MSSPTTETRLEIDSFGTVLVPARAYWGAQTQRSLQNFPFDVQERLPISIIHALLRVSIVRMVWSQISRKPLREHLLK